MSNYSIRYKFKIFGISAIMLLPLSLKSQTDQLEKAKRLIQTTKADPYAGDINSGPEYELYHRQLEAIELLSNSKIEMDVPRLISFLNYTDNLATRVSAPPLSGENLDLTRKKWPVFAAILDDPGAATGLDAYFKTTSNPINYRLSALVVLRYVDTDRFHKDCEDVKFQEEINRLSAPYKVYFKAIPGGKVAFWGVLAVQYNGR